MTRFRHRLETLGATIVLFLASLSRSALGAPNDAAAGNLRQQAIEQDYLSTDFAAAEAKLTKAVALCKSGSACTPALQARIHCDLAVVYFAEQKKDDADTQFAEAVKDDPNVTVSPDLSTAELQRELTKVKSKSAKAAAETTTDAPSATDAPARKGATGAAPSSESNDCPPGFPGCKSAPTTCSTNDDCSGGESCQDGTCHSQDSGEALDNAEAKANWLSVAVEQDFLLLPSASQVCAGGSGYTCFDSGNHYYNGIPLTGTGTADSVSGGLAPATQRFTLGYDRAFGANFTVGARIGFAISGGPTRPGGTGFFPLQLEARATYWVGHNALGRKGFRPFVLVAGGGADVAASLSAYAYNQGSTTATQYNAWKQTGEGFGAVGLGTMFAFAPNNGIVLEVRGMEMFPTSGTGLGVQLGYTYGL